MTASFFTQIHFRKIVIAINYYYQILKIYINVSLSIASLGPISFLLQYKNLFLKEIKPTTSGTWFGQSEKGRNNPRQYGTKKLPPLLSRTTIGTLSTNSRTKLEGRKKIARRWVSSFASWIADKYFKQARSFPRNKTKNKRMYEFGDQL